jgi:allantoicase
MLECCDATSTFDADRASWRPLVAETPLQPHTRHVFETSDTAAATHVRLNIYPDGGVARLRLIGRAVAK